MLIFVEGFQGVGKTTLLESSGYSYNHFPFAYYVKEFGFKDEKLTGFQFGKDLGILYALRNINLPLLFDRGPFSSVYYSLKEKRCSEEFLRSYLKEISKYKDCKYLFIQKVNGLASSERKRSDGFDYLNDENDSKKEERFEQMKNLANEYGIKFHFFENDFSKNFSLVKKDFKIKIKELTK